MTSFNFENPFSKKPKGPEFKTVGGASEKEKDKARKQKEKALNQHNEFLRDENFEEIKKYEYGKTQEEVEMINLANKEINKMMKKVGAEPYDIPLDNYHLFSKNYYEENAEGSNGVTYFPNQTVALNADELRKAKVPFFKTTVHETFHLKGKFVMEVQEDESGVSETAFREGMSVNSSQKEGEKGGYHTHFEGVHEAIAAKASKDIVLDNIKNNPFFKEEKEIFNSEEMRQKKEEINIPEDEILWITEDNEIICAPSRKPREVVNYVCKEVAKELPDEFSDEEAVFDKFLQAHFSGELLPLARAVEKTFGKGSFRTLGNMIADRQSAILTLENLKKKRN
ncbi:MAG: hypothetical protein ACQEP3_01815 [Patescibacteria group bacterium]